MSPYAQDDSDGITIIDAFAVPRYNYDTQRRVFHQSTKAPTITAEADSKIQLYRERFLLLHQRILRNRMFVKPSFNCGAAMDRTFCELTPLTGLLGNANQTRYVMGCLSQLEDDRYFLEDLTGQIQVDVSHAATTSGLYTENCIVVAEVRPAHVRLITRFLLRIHPRPSIFRLFAHSSVLVRISPRIHPFETGLIRLISLFLFHGPVSLIVCSLCTRTRTHFTQHASV